MARQHADPVARLRYRRDLASAGQVAIGAIAVLLGGGVSIPTLLAFAAMSGWALTRSLPDLPSPSVQRLWTLGVFAALVATIARAVLRAEFLDAGVDFLLLLVVQRLFQRQRSREHMQLLLLGALLMVIGAVINAELSYPPLLAAYILVAVHALILNNLVAEGERLGPRVMLELSREGLRRHRSLLQAAAGVAALAAIGAVVTFLVFPRWGVGAFLRGSMASEVRSGFSNEVRLGGFGTIKHDATVVMHIVPHNAGRLGDRVDWYLRGSAFDAYDNGQWRTDRLGETGELHSVWGFASLAPGGRPLVRRASTESALPIEAVPRQGAQAPEQVLHATVTLEDIGADVLFVASEPLALRLRPRGPVEERARLHAGRNREFRIGKPPGPVQYEFVSRLSETPREQLDALGDPPIGDAYATYVQRSTSLSPKARALAQQLTAGATSRVQKVEAVMEHLAEFSYTLDQPQTGAAVTGDDPLDGFLFESRAGHCEYFATALAVLLREVDVPTRIVNGYLGAHENRLGGFYAVRQADAHSWVEVHFGSLGWVTFDPTPPEGRRAGHDAPLWPAFSELMDAARTRYLDWVIGFDLGKQLTLLERAGMRGGGQQPKIAWGTLLAWMAGIGGTWLLLVGLGRVRRTPPVSSASKLWTGVVADLTTRGYVPTVAESPSAFARRVGRDHPPLARPIAELARRYEALRFGPSAHATQLAALAKLTRATRLAIRVADW